jgi:hypothetical protein
LVNFGGSCNGICLYIKEPFCLFYGYLPNSRKIDKIVVGIFCGPLE